MVYGKFILYAGYKFNIDHLTVDRMGLPIGQRIARSVER